MARIALINHANVDPSALSDVAEEAALPAGEVRLIVGDPLLGDEYQAVTIARPFATLAGNLWGLEDFLNEHWDCGVVLGSKWATRQPDFPAYFAYLLGHEFGHATTILTNLTLAVYEDIVLRYMPKVLDRECRWDEMPQEILYDRFGVAIAEALFGRERFHEDLRRLLSSNLTQDKPRIEKLFELQPTKNLRVLWGQLAAFSLPHRDRLLEFWRGDMASGRLKITAGLSDLTKLWSAS